MNANVVSRSKVLLRIDLSRFGIPTLASCHQKNNKVKSSGNSHYVMCIQNSFKISQKYGPKCLQEKNHWAGLLKNMCV